MWAPLSTLAISVHVCAVAESAKGLCEVEYKSEGMAITGLSTVKAQSL